MPVIRIKRAKGDRTRLYTVRGAMGPDDAEQQALSHARAGGWRRVTVTLSDLDDSGSWLVVLMRSAGGTRSGGEDDAQAKE